MNRQERRKLERERKREIKQRKRDLPSTLTQVHKSEWPHQPDGLLDVWASKKYVVQVYSESHGVLRLSINRTDRTGSGWTDQLTWDELQQIKSDVGFGEFYAYEVYPSDDRIVNAANMRHLWITPAPLQFGW